MYKNERTHMI